MTAMLANPAVVLEARPNLHADGASSGELPHVLAVAAQFDPEFPDDAFRVEHHPTCPAQLGEDKRGGLNVLYYCHVGVHEVAGLSSFFQHCDDDTLNDGRDMVSAGRHVVEAWSSRKYAHDDEIEYDGGLRVVRSLVGTR